MDDREDFAASEHDGEGRRRISRRAFVGGVVAAGASAAIGSILWLESRCEDCGDDASRRTGPATDTGGAPEEIGDQIMVNSEVADPDRFGIDAAGRAYYDAGGPDSAEAADVTIVDGRQLHLEVQ